MAQLARFLLRWTFRLLLCLQLIFCVVGQSRQMLVATPVGNNSLSLALVHPGWIACVSSGQGSYFYLNTDINIRQAEIDRMFGQSPDGKEQKSEFAGVRLVRWKQGTTEVRMISVRHVWVIFVLSAVMLLNRWMARVHGPSAAGQ